MLARPRVIRPRAGYGRGMTKRTFLSGGLACLWLAVAACTGPGKANPAGVKPRGSTAPRPSAGAGGASASPGATGDAADRVPAGPPATPPPGLLAGAFGGLVSNNGGNVVRLGDPAGMKGGPATTIAGLVTAPAELITDNGAGMVGPGSSTMVGPGSSTVVSNQGGAMVGPGSSMYRLAAADDVPYAGAMVFLLAADGTPLEGPDGLPVASRTDAAGRYAFTGAIPEASNYLVVVSLPGTRGQLGAIAPKGLARVADVDLVSTLATGYVLDRYVRPQAKRQAVLDRLPPEMEAATRQAVGDALGAGAAAAGGPPLAVVSAAEIGRVVDGLRAKAAPLDTQLEEVRKLLVAGLSDLGSGRAANEVALPWIRGVAIDPAGGYWLNAALSGRVYHVGADGILATAAGSGAGEQAGSVAGLAAGAAGLGTIQGLLPDGDGLLILEQRRLTRLGADAKLTELWPRGETRLVAVGRAGDGRYRLLAQDGLYEVAPGAAPTKVRAIAGADAAFLGRVGSFGQDAAGRLVLLAGGAPYGEVRRYDPASGALAVVVASDAADVRGIGLDGAGRVYLQGADGAIRVREGDAERPLIPAGAGVTAQYAHFAAAPGGATLWALLGAVYRVEGATKTLVAGKVGVAVDETGQIALNRPGGLLVEPDGALVLAVAGDNQVARVRGAEVAIVAGTGQAGTAGDGGPATAAPLANPTALRRDAAGSLYVLAAGRAVRKVAPDGTISTAYALPEASGDRRIYDAWPTRDGAALYVTGAVITAGGVPRDGFVSKIALPSKAETPIVAAADSAGRTHVIALDAEDRLHLMGGGALRRWDPAAGFATVAEHATLATSLRWTALGRAAFDPKGRFWWFSGEAASQLNRLVDGRAEVVAGPGAPLLAGEGVDDSLLNGMAPAFGADGDVYFADYGHNQVKRLPGAAR